jgi:hypothetical protein
MQIRDVIDSDWPVIWGFMQQILAAGDTYCWPTDTSEDAARAWWMGKPGGRVLVAVDEGAVVGTAEVHPNQPLPVATSPTQASWCRRPQPVEVWDVPWPTACSRSQRRMGLRRCSSTQSWRPMSPPYASGNRSASRYLPPCRKRSDILTVDWSAFTSCTDSCDNQGSDRLRLGQTHSRTPLPRLPTVTRTE